LGRGHSLIHRYCVALAVVSVAPFLLVGAAQQPTAPEPAPVPRPGAVRGAAANFPTKALVSPEVNGDRTVTLRFRAPQATEVSLTGEITQGKRVLPMTKGADGIWTTTVGPLAPEVWSYNFRIDGIDILDPSNPAVKPVPPGQAMSNFVEVQGPETAFMDSQAVPHGDVRMMLYESPGMGFTRSLWVYTPPGYDEGRTRYPVLYLLHGNGEDQQGWVRNGRANIILDNLIALKKAKPMIVVMPQGHALQAQNVEPLRRITDETSMFSPRFEPDLLQVIIPLVERRFRVKADADDRAIAGLSMGGGQALGIGLSHTKMFHYVLGFSAAIGPNFLDISETVKNIEESPAAVNKDLRMLWISCGRQDFLFQPNKRLDQSLTEHRVAHKYVETEGAHVWSVWRKNLEAGAPLLFR
jgi:enterochelin esterase-like enzyme